MKLQAFDILHCKRKTMLSKAIGWATDSEITHTAVVIEIYGDLFVIDAQINGVVPKKLDYWLERYKYQFYVSRPKFKIDSEQFGGFATKDLGIKYDWPSLIFRQPILIATGIWIGKNTKDDDKLYCSDYVAGIFYNYLPYLLAKYWMLSPIALKRKLDESERFKTIETWQGQ